MNRALLHTSGVAFLTFLVTAGLVSGCAGEANSSVQEEPLVIEAYVEGTVTSGVTHTPIAGATVALPGVMGEAGSTTTDSNGFYSLKAPGVGAHTLFVSAKGYARAKYSFSANTEPGASGQIQVTAVRNSQLYPTSDADGGALSGRVASGGGRDLIAGAKVLVQFLDTSDPIEDASLKVTAQTDSDGKFMLKNLPAGAPQTRVTVLPADVDDDGKPDTAVFSNFVSGGPSNGVLTPGGQNFMDIVVDPYIGDKVLWTNLDDRPSLDPDEEIVVAYAESMVDTKDATLVTLAEGADRVKVDFEWEDNLKLTVTPLEPLLQGHTYTLSVQTQSTAGVPVALSRSFLVTSAEAPPDAVTGLEIVDADPVPWSTRRFTLAWDAASDVDGNPIDTYRVLARNDARQTTWTILFEGAVSRFSRPQLQVNLPESFDSFPNEDVFSAVGFGTTVEFAVQAYSGRNDGPISEEPATFQDTHCPSLTVTPPVTTDNSLGTEELVVKFLISSNDNEPLSDDSEPKFTFADGTLSTDPFVISGAPRVRRVRAGQLEYSFAIPKGKTGAGDTLTLDLSKVTDTSGNGPDGSAGCVKTQSLTLN
ncbi:MAG TPA: carboxypeptidase regulatory-like domain-containing protein [Polyangiaceae bacterium]|nr:carboxypeptidase regulatory-like domain-containing protein [Polyangiaceae bacterium]